MAQANQNDEYAVLQSSLDNTLTMLSYAAKRGIILSKYDIINVMSAISGIRSNNLPPENQADFWAASSSISRAIEPATLDSLESCMPHKDGKNPANAAAKKYRQRTVITLMALLVFQIYWLIGATLITDLNTTKASLATLADQDATLTRSMSEIDQTKLTVSYKSQKYEINSTLIKRLGLRLEQTLKLIIRS